MRKITAKNYLNYFLNTTIIIVVFSILIKNNLLSLDYLISLSIVLFKTTFNVFVFIISKTCYYGFVYGYPFLALLLVFLFKSGYIELLSEKKFKIMKFIIFYIINAILLYFSLSIFVKNAILIYIKSPYFLNPTGQGFFYLTYSLAFIHYFIVLLFYKKR